MVFFISDNPNRNRGLSVAHGDSTGLLPLSAQPTLAGALAPQSFSSRVLVADGRSCCTRGGWAEGRATECFKNSRKQDWLVTQERALHESTLSQRSTREEKEISQKSRASAFSGHLEI